MNYQKYKPYKKIKKANRKWPDNEITKAPIWCSVDLRDGNQALETPMNLEQKINFFNYLVKLGFKEIEVGFPAASDTEYTFTRTLIDNHMIPKDVTIQVLTQLRTHILDRTFASLEGVHKAIVHLYNSVSTIQRDVVFRKSKEEIKALAVDGARQAKKLAKKYGEERFIFEYSPESFPGAEVDYVVEVCNAVLDELKPTSENKVIINLPNTVELCTANVFADLVEYICENLKYRENVIVSLHSHNDRGTGIAASELGLMAGADRIEGTLFGNGERTGNMDIVNFALNLLTQGVDPKLNFSDMDEMIKVYEESTKMSIHPRHPYAGKLVFTAFSGSHQDAINKGMAHMEKENLDYWDVPYLPIDPKDVGRNYDAIIRINSQSGKGGVSYILKTHYDLHLPKAMQQDFGPIITQISDQASKELTPKEIYEAFISEYVNIESPLQLINYVEQVDDNHQSTVRANLISEGEKVAISGHGNGVIDAFCKGLSDLVEQKIDIASYSEHALENGSTSKAITYIQIHTEQGDYSYGSGISPSVTRSSLQAIVSATNRVLKKVVVMQ
ncbi:2-isopropylmalate synthase [Terrilactibacillus laevilacticus]|uniref:2-isopropylmalate synthase n=1 Tax=Terrilactibacillus laevilacticus TaxID=1380157 RepID=UPI001146256C|nr:2-isopropylmalate synthase [Terrilactibacillus laevilacticus]